MINVARARANGSIAVDNKGDTVIRVGRCTPHVGNAVADSSEQFGLLWLSQRSGPFRPLRRLHDESAVEQA